MRDAVQWWWCYCWCWWNATPKNGIIRDPIRPATEIKIKFVVLIPRFHRVEITSVVWQDGNSRDRRNQKHNRRSRADAAAAAATKDNANVRKWRRFVSRGLKPEVIISFGSLILLSREILVQFNWRGILNFPTILGTCRWKSLKSE